MHIFKCDIMVSQNLKKKIKYYSFFVYFIMIAIIAKLSYIQIVNYNEVNDKANESWNRSFPLQASRGIIYDNSFNELATNIACMSVYVIPIQVENKKEVAKQLADILNANEITIYNKINKNTSIVKIFPEGKNINSDTAKKISNLNQKGVYLVYDNQHFLQNLVLDKLYTFIYSTIAYLIVFVSNYFLVVYFYFLYSLAI